MGSNRKRPFGYKMELGEIVLHPAEAETVRWLYDSYLAGASYNALVDKLRERGISYDGDKPWNKNMAARILADSRYTGGRCRSSSSPRRRFSVSGGDPATGAGQVIRSGCWISRFRRPNTCRSTHAGGLPPHSFRSSFWAGVFLQGENFSCL